MAQCIGFILDLMRFLNKDTYNVVLTPFGLEVTLLSILSGTKNVCYYELKSAIFDKKSISSSTISEFMVNVKSIVDEIKSILGADIKLHTFIYVSSQFNFNEEYLDFVSKNFDTKVKQLIFVDNNLESYNVIDAQVSEATMGRINHVLKNIPTVGNNLIINISLFDPGYNQKLETIESPFITPVDIEYGYESVNISFAKNCGTFNYYKDSQLTAVELTYSVSSNLYLCLILPNQQSSTRDLLMSFSRNYLFTLFKSFTKKNLEIHIPLIKLTMNIDISNIWQLLGIQRIFDKETADLSEMISNPKGLCIESIILNSQIELQGDFKECSNPSSSYTTKSSVISKSSSNKKAKSPSISANVLKFNKPFIYFITCDTKFQQERLLVFAGTVNNVNTDLMF